MAHLTEVAFKGNRKEFYLWDAEASLALRTAVIVEADRGEDLGRVHAVGDLAALRARGCTHGTGDADPTMKVLRVATADEVRKYAELRAQDDTARRDAMGFVKTHALSMKLTDTEWRWDRRKLTIYFTADRRVDFRALVRDLAAHFRTRIELKQIGVRDEAKRLDGIGRCGRQYCSASWLRELRPVNLGLAKDQKLSLNPTQISGACGRLMCCLRYEHDWYVETRRLFPKEGKSVTTSLGEERVVANDLFRELVTLRKMSDGELRVVPLAQLNRELRGEPVETDAATDTASLEDWNDELLSMTDTTERPIPRTFRQRPGVDRPVTLARATQRQVAPDKPQGAKAAEPRNAAPASQPMAPPAPNAKEQHDQAGDAGQRTRRRRGRRGGRRGGGRGGGEHGGGEHGGGEHGGGEHGGGEHGGGEHGGGEPKDGPPNGGGGAE